MRSWHPWLLIVAMAACSGDKDPTNDDNVPTDGDADTDTDSDTDTDTDTDTDCTATIASISPADNTFLVPLDTVVTVTFSEPIAADDPYSIEVSGATGTATLAADGGSATWTGALNYETDYTITASVCDDSVDSDFRTLPEPVDPATFEGTTYALPWENLNITAPGNDQALNAFINVDYILAQVVTVDGTLADAVATVGYTDPVTSELVPDCTVATEQTADFSLNPYFSISGDLELVFNAAGDSVTVEQFSLLARMAADGQSITNVNISGLVATEVVTDGLDCTAVAILLNGTCLACTSSATGQCLQFEASATEAPVYGDIDLNGQCFGATTDPDTGTSIP